MRSLKKNSSDYLGSEVLKKLAPIYFCQESEKIDSELFLSGV